jgi:hypothetical protein
MMILKLTLGTPNLKKAPQEKQAYGELFVL